jgi:hypothetical protein
MLDIEGGDYINAVANKLFDVLITLVVARARRVGVRQLVHDRELGLARQNGIDIHLLQDHAAIWNLAERDGLEVTDPSRGLGPPVRLDEAEHHVMSLFT